MPHIFLSYNRDDQEAAKQFVQGFEAAGLTVWWDATLRAGEAYDEITENALREARAVVVIWSKRSVASRWVRAEATLAQRLGTFIPCMIEPCERPILFELTQTADLTRWTGEPDDMPWLRFVEHVKAHVHRPEGEKSGSRPRQTIARPKVAPQPLNERRQVTFVSAQIAGGDELASQLDPEDWHELITHLRPSFESILTQFGGSAKWSGHALQAVFGFPVGHEDAAQRAIRAGLALTERVKGLASDLHGALARPLDLMVGIHTCNVLITAGRDGEAEMFGDGEAVASLARDSAPAGAILVTEAVSELTAGAFRLQAFEAASAGGALYEVLGLAAANGSTRGWASGVTTRFVGRDDELAQLHKRWKRAVAGASQHVLIRGEPGIGKTRLVEEFQAGLTGTEHFWITLHGASMFPNTPWYALEQMLGQFIEGSGQATINSLENRLGDLGISPALRTMLAPLFGLKNDQSQRDSNQNLEHERNQLLGGLTSAVFELAQNRPLVVLIDDVQWIDPSTLELVQMLVEQSDADRLLVLATARPEFHPPWSEHDHHHQINLGRLDQDEVRALVINAMGDNDLPQATIESLLDRADGVPLFAEELAHMLSEGVSAGPDGTLPPTLQALLTARMDRLGPPRELLQVAAILGRSFSHALFAEVSERPLPEFEIMLEQLTSEQFLFARGAPPLATYRFKHALVQDAAYGSLPKRGQRELHARAARTIVEKFPEIAESQIELLATHWTRGGEPAEAAAAWRKAGDSAFVRAACKEAVSHYRNGLAAIAQLPESVSRDEAELTLWSALNRALQQMLGYSDPQTVEAANRAIALAKKSGVLARIMVENAQLWRARINTGDYRDADAIAEQVLRMSAESGESEPPPWVAYFHANARVQTDFYAGRISKFETDFADLRLSLKNEKLNHSPTDDVVSIGVSSLAAWMAGRSDEASRRAEEAIALGRSSGHPYAIAVAHHFAGTLTAFEGDRAGTREHAQKALEVCEENGFEYIKLLARAKLGWASTREESANEDIEAMRLSLQKMVEANALVGMIINMNRLAIALEVHGRNDEAMSVVEAALTTNPQELIARPQTLEIRGRLKSAQGDHVGAAADYREAIEQASAMGAIALELSAALHLARLLVGQGLQLDAIAVLEASLGRCDPSTNTPDLPAVRAYLAELRQAGLTNVAPT